VSTAEVLALDVAGNMGVTDGRVGEVPRLYTVRLSRPDDDDVQRFARAVEWIIDRVRVSTPTVVYIEAPVGPGGMHGQTNATTTIQLVGYWAVLSGLLRYRRIPVHAAHVATIRKFFLDDGHMRGDLAKEECMRIARLEGADPQNDNEGDAYALWRYAASFYGGAGPPRDLW
jgi:hypothetical protein